MDTPADRLRYARERKGIKTAAEAARRLGMGVTTYQNYEDGSRGFARHAVKLGRFYKVRPQWLTDGHLPMTDSELEEKFDELTPTNQAKLLEYWALLSGSQSRK